MRASPFLLHHRLRASAERRPDAVAVSCGDQRLTYAQLWARSGALAALLQRVGVTPGDRVAIQLPKSVDTIACWFGALRAGAAYLPLDPQTPPANVRAVLEQAQARVLIAPTDRAEALGALPPGVTPVWTSAGGPGGLHLGEAEGAPREGALTDEALAYVYFTSGSTGRPKGVMISHRASVSYLEISQGILGCGPDDVVGNHASLAFDLASFDVHLALGTGAAVSLVPEAATLLPGGILRFFTEARPTLLYTVPTTLNRLAALRSLGQLTVPSLRALLFAGEPPHVRALETLRRPFPNATFHHWYGSTEAALVTAAAFPPGTPLPDPLPIGAPVENVAVAVWDEARACPAPAVSGAEGELLVSATLLLDGYCRAPELNAETFVAEPLADGRSRRWFRTRDRIRVLGDGSLEFLGRMDRVVKVSGMRVELGEVEAAAARLGGVSECCVLTVPDAQLGRRLIAFAVAPGISEDALRAHLQSQLKPYAVPSELRLQAAFPRTTTGKIDRQALQRALDAERGE